MSKTRAIRLADRDEALIQEFLDKNPLFDFSSLARVAILKFIESPSVEIKPVLPPKDAKSKSRRLDV